MAIIFDETYEGYEGTINTSGSNNSYNPDNLGTPDTISFGGTQDLNDPTTQVTINGAGPTDFFVEQWGTMTSTVTGFDYEYVIINVGGTLYMFLHEAGSGVGIPLSTGTDPFAAGNQNPLDPTPYCFVRGALISTESGEVFVENLSVGDTVHTRDNGLQTISWIGKRTMSKGANSRHTPIRIMANALGDACRNVISWFPLNTGCYLTIGVQK